jgi:hypothetical protein
MDALNPTFRFILGAGTWINTHIIRLILEQIEGIEPVSVQLGRLTVHRVLTCVTLVSYTLLLQSTAYLKWLQSQELNLRAKAYET